mmetsp:Transcript_92997/g.259968  ORF Transcript_92997/g.259968 Transcript_92997/m.259968 type:complete len:161 (+) Transcript_92997:209-691(+)|eukprot:CAMPEP_0176238514 /NCGR_PEP_ID=MMETSP0121_2-20121125/28404_1 /TAXON_ID=160619 /ORGANISM="Kryptoperidinium foliaceum, Strain CCMP 1326" /LENGTH=160 /DNA_ID=CAMNT_0017577991 /DNA_START=121 /DNA_END=603 /DNA_ORIENTATION=+
MVQELPLKGNLKKNGKQNAKNSEKKVDFSSLEIYEFLITIGDNPSCEGAPLCISDECQKKRKLDLNEFEATRKSRRHRKQLVLSATKRSRLLMALGFTMEDIATAALETQKARQEREETLSSQKWDKFSFVFESATRRLKKIVNKTKPQPTQTAIAPRMA